MIHVAEYVEVESGKRVDRPQLEAAIEEAQASGAVLVILKLDRLSRNAHILLDLQKAGIEFVACDNPEANRLTIGVLAVVAQHEREMIAERTKAALAALDPAGTMSARALAQTLNDRGIPSPRQGQWTAQSIIRLRKRLTALS